MLLAHLGHTWVFLTLHGGGMSFVLGHFLLLSLFLANHFTLFHFLLLLFLLQVRHGEQASSGRMRGKSRKRLRL